METNIIGQTDFWEKCALPRMSDEFIRHLIHDELDTQELYLVERHRLYDWLFPEYYTKEEKEILDLFSQMVSERKTAIYGTGIAARILLNCGFYNQIAGVMDKKRPGTLFYKKVIMNEEQAVEAGITQIVVAAKVGNYRIVAGKIVDFCEKNGILLRGLNGRNLLQWCGAGVLKYNWMDRQYIALNSDILKTQIDNHEAISFDVFDTLIMRKVMQPTDLFYLVGQKAKISGISPAIYAEKRRYADKYNKYEKNIFGIYHTLQEILMLTDEERDRLVALEVETEMQMAVCRNEMVDIFRYALSCGKRVFLISDMHLTESMISKILSGLGIEGYEKLLVSCDYHCGKTSGLFHIYKGLIQKGRCLHIGDNEISDGAASKEGIDVFLVRSAMTMLKASNLNTLKGYACSMKEQNALGLLLAEIFNNPFGFHAGHGIMQVGTYKEWGYRFLGVYVVAYIDWLARQLKESQVDKMLFSTRDGYLFYDLYQWYRKNVNGAIPEAIYFKTSRKLCYLASMSDEESIEFFLNYDDVYAPEELLEKRFLLEKDDILPYSDEGRWEYVKKHKEKIFQKAAVIREKYFSYMDSIGLQEDREYGFFDSYCRGTVQYLMERFVPFGLHGFYLGKIHNARGLKSVRSFYVDKGDYMKLDDINVKRTLMEYCFSSPETNIIGMDEDGNFIYAEEYRTDRDIKHMLDIQEGIREFFVGYYSSFPVGEESFSGSLPNAVINTMDFVELTGECSDMDTIRSIDDMVNKGYAVWNI
ncbi:hypothetical protein IMSAGC019_03562 [Lachnospiraceae bacterium]|nr:hypothetical protein IMSAGC019_03562 [Lachnospiraceae bacterium]